MGRAKDNIKKGKKGKGMQLESKRRRKEKEIVAK